MDRKSGWMPHRAGARGFTLVELMIAVLLLVIVLAVAAPPLRQLVHGNRLRTEASRLRDRANQRLEQSGEGDMHTAFAAYERAQLAFDKARQAIEHAQRLLGDIEGQLRNANPRNLRNLDDDVRGQFEQARRQLTIANGAMQAGVRDFNTGARHYDDAPGIGSEGLADYVREQSQQKAFAVTRMLAQTKSALIELRDQTRYLKDPACEPEIRAQYESVIGLLTQANRDYLDADSVPTQADQAMATADAAVAQAEIEAEAALTRFEQCIRR